MRKQTSNPLLRLAALWPATLWVATLIWSLQALSAASSTLTYCSEGSPTTFNPQYATDGATFTASARTIYNRLVDFEPGTTNLIPSLAESWTTSQDGLSVTFKLRAGVEFHTTSYFRPTRPLNADDVLFTFNRMRSKDHAYHSVGGGVYKYFQSMAMDQIIRDIVKIDDHTVRFVLARPEAPFVANVAMDFASILSAEYADTLLKSGKLENLDSEPIGTGPFTFVRYDRDQLIRFQAHPKYFLGAAKLQKLVFYIAVDPAVRVQKLRRGECQLISDPPPSEIAALRKDPSFQVAERETLNVGYLAMNVEKKPLGDLRVRQAIQLAINRQALIDSVYSGMASIAKNPIPPGSWGYNSEVTSFALDLEKSKKLLAEAGYPSGFDIELWYLPVSRPYNPNGKKLGDMIQSDLAKVGIRVKLITFDWSTFLEKSRNGEHQLINFGWSGDNGDPDNFLGTLLSCSGVRGGTNLARWCFKEFDDLVAQARSLRDQDKRAVMYRKAQEIFQREAPWVPIAHGKVTRVLRKNVEGYVQSPLGYESFFGVSLRETR